MKTNMNKNILLGITGGIAAYKSANICSLLKKNGYNVKVIMTKNATEIITPLTLETLSKNRVGVDMWAEKSNIDVEHIDLADWADLVLIAPATYNIIGKVANGIADDMLSTVISATCAPTYFALAMNVNMYNNPILKDNIKKLETYGYNFIDADSGLLACDWIAKGRLKKLSGSGINFNWDEFVGTIFSPAARPHVHKAFLVLLTASTAYVGGKGIVSLLPQEDILKKQNRRPPIMSSSTSLRSEVKKIKANNIFNARKVFR